MNYYNDTPSGQKYKPLTPVDYDTSSKTMMINPKTKIVPSAENFTRLVY